MNTLPTSQRPSQRGNPSSGTARGKSGTPYVHDMDRRLMAAVMRDPQMLEALKDQDGEPWSPLPAVLTVIGDLIVIGLAIVAALLCAAHGWRW